MTSHHVSIERMGRIILISGFLKSNSSIICVLLSRTYDLLDDHVGDHASFRMLVKSLILLLLK